MPIDPFQVLQTASRPTPAHARRPSLLVAGATGVLGSEVLRRLAGAGRYSRTWVLAREAFTDGVAGVTTVQVPGDTPAVWPPVAASVAVVMFEPPRLYHDRERALWTPNPEQLPALATWLRSCGVQRLAVVLPHAQGRLPDALKRGLASLDEQAVAALGFDCVIFVRGAQKPAHAASFSSWPARTAAWMLSVLQFMVPTREQPVPSTKVAAFVALALQRAPAGVHVAAPETVWQAGQQDLEGAVEQWLAR